MGGLGSSRYLSHLLRTEYHTENTGSNVEIRSSSDNDTYVWQFADPSHELIYHSWSAVCRGAVMATQQETVVSRVSRWHYGLSYNVPFEPENREHRSLGDDRMRWEGAEGRQLVTGKMHWIVNRVSFSENVVSLLTTEYRVQKSHTFEQHPLTKV